MIPGKRIMILGSAGSGKSTLATLLGEITGNHVTHLDRLFWNPGWVQTPREEMTRRVTEAASAENWIIDGNYSNHAMDLRFERADCVIYLDFGRYFCIYRILKRRIQHHGKTRYDLGEGCPEKIGWEFFLWVWNYPRRTRPKLLEQLAARREQGGCAVYHLRTRGEVKNFISKCKAGELKG